MKIHQKHTTSTNFYSIENQHVMSSQNRAKSDLGDVDANLVDRSLCDVNNFTTRGRTTDKLPPVLMYEITSDGGSQYKEMTLRELLHYINGEATKIDEKATERDAVKRAKDDDVAVSRTKSSSYMQDNTFKVDNDDDLLPSYQSDEISSNLSQEEPIICAVTELRLRDLRRLDYQFNPGDENTILIRRHAVLTAIDPLRAVVMSDRLILIVPPGADSLLTILDGYMKDCRAEDAEDEETYRNQAHHPAQNNHHHHRRPTPFESHAYEALLNTVHCLETGQFARVSAAVRTLVGQCSRATMLPIAVQETLRDVKNELSLMRGRVGSTREALRVLTEDDADMALMSLSALKLRPDLYSYPLSNEILSRHEEMEELLESYLLDFNSLVTSLALCSSQIDSAEDLVSLRLDTSRNELLIANTTLTVLACCIAFSAYITGVFGMNLDNVSYLQPMRGLFVGVTGATLLLIPLLYCSVCRYLRYSRLLPGGLPILSLHGSYADDAEK